MARRTTMNEIKAKELIEMIAETGPVCRKHSTRHANHRAPASERNYIKLVANVGGDLFEVIERWDESTRVVFGKFMVFINGKRVPDKRLKKLPKDVVFFEVKEAL